MHIYAYIVRSFFLWKLIFRLKLRAGWRKVEAKGGKGGARLACVDLHFSYLGGQDVKSNGKNLSSYHDQSIFK